MHKLPETKLLSLKEALETHPHQLLTLFALQLYLNVDTRHAVYMLVHRLRKEHHMKISTVYHKGYIYKGE